MLFTSSSRDYRYGTVAEVGSWKAQFSSARTFRSYRPVPHLSPSGPLSCTAPWMRTLGFIIWIWRWWACPTAWNGLNFCPISCTSNPTTSIQGRPYSLFQYTVLAVCRLAGEWYILWTLVCQYRVASTANRLSHRCIGYWIMQKLRWNCVLALLIGKNCMYSRHFILVLSNGPPHAPGSGGHA